MLTLTPDATQAIDQLLEAPEIPEGAGIRIASSAAASDSGAPSPGDLKLTVAEEPETSDEVIDQAGARVFLEQTVAEFLDDKLLDADIVDEGVRFKLGDRT
ncbi:MAG TPA: HesB/YadR/YfhF-family protein [Solirubrobacteraceae bacterium]|jgi:Fe-S cluster assembly iron-binding protein IscA